MDAFDRLLQRELALMLDPVVGAPVPRRHRPRALGAMFAITGGLSDPSADRALLAEGVPTPIPLTLASPVS